MVQARCRKLGIACQQGVADKLAVLRAWLAQQGTDLAHTVYVGNDVNDLDCLRAVGCGVVVGDAHRAVRAVASIHLESPGGQGAIRELCDLIAARGNLPAGAASGRP